MALLSNRSAAVCAAAARGIASAMNVATATQNHRVRYVMVSVSSNRKLQSQQPRPHRGSVRCWSLKWILQLLADEIGLELDPAGEVPVQTQRGDAVGVAEHVL